MAAHPYSRASVPLLPTASRRAETVSASMQRELAGSDSAYALRPQPGSMLEQLIDGVAGFLDCSYAASTSRVDASHWRAWERITTELGTPALRDNMAANSGADPAGFRTEVILKAVVLVRKYMTMRPRSNADAAADPRSAMACISGVSREHQRRGISMAPSDVAWRVLKGMCRSYVLTHGVRDVRRKKPLDNTKIAGMLATPEGAARAGLVWSWRSYAGVAHRAWICTLAEEGSRKDEIARGEASAPSCKGRFTFASLVWKIGGVEVPDPTPAQLASLSEARGDGAYLEHGTAKNDFFGAFFAAVPSFLPFSSSSPRCAARALRRLECTARASGLRPEQRAATPLFGPALGVEFTHREVELAFELLLTRGAGVPDGELKDYSIHSFRIFVACALLAADVSRADIKRLLRWRGDESLEVYARLNDEEWRARVRSTYTAHVGSTVAARLAGLGPLDFEQVAPTLAEGIYSTK